ncbi:MAG: PPOX class F420-dependent oxidoreductase [Anaerolineales bacterium]
MKNLPAEYLDLFKDETKSFLYLATSMSDGSPQVTPIWFNTDGEYILINTNEGRVKDKNMQARAKVALVVQDPSNPYRYVQIRGEVAARVLQGADEHINALSLKYKGVAWQAQPEQKRVIYKIKINRIDAH